MAKKMSFFVTWVALSCFLPYNMLTMLLLSIRMLQDLLVEQGRGGDIALVSDGTSQVTHIHN